MKVTGPKDTKSTSKTAKTGKSSSASKQAGASGASFGSFLVDTASEAEGNAAAKSISRLEGLISIQAEQDPAEKGRQSRMRQRAHDLLDSLESIKMALLNGNLRVSHLENITNIVAGNRERIDDPELTYLLDEIDLRAQVELAKLEAAKQAVLKQMSLA
ncbi:MAG: flagellar assembly protein FliX [Micavibrio sp.]|nr:flagellar assembly protein FliX [Micavibrio sp.]